MPGYRLRGVGALMARLVGGSLPAALAVGYGATALGRLSTIRLTWVLTRLVTAATIEAGREHTRLRCSSRW